MAQNADQPQSAEEALKTFQNHNFCSLQLRQDLVSRWSENNPTGVYDRTDNFTALTNLSDSAYDIDPNDMSKIEAELAEFKSYLSAVKFNWMEVNVKRRYISRVLGSDVDRLVSQQDNDEIDAIRASKKAALQDLKATTAKLDSELLEVATAIDSIFPSVSSLSDAATPLVSSIADLELELRALKAARRPDELTVSEAEAKLNEQEAEMTDVMERVENGKADIIAKKAELVKERREAEKLNAEREAVEKAEAEARKSIGGGGGEGRQIEKGCIWYTRTTELYRSLLGILSVKSLGEDPASPLSIQLTYDLGHPHTATLALDFFAEPRHGRRLCGAYLVDSMEDISDIVEPAMVSGDVALLVREVFTRIAR